MKRILPGLGLLILCATGFGQTTYKGNINKLPIELVTDVYSEGIATAVYVYTDFDTPIRINGKLEHNVLTLVELNQSGKRSATLTFNPFDGAMKKVSGIWKNLESSKELPITLTREFQIDAVRVKESDREILQAVSLPYGYFRIVISTKDGFPRVTGVKLYEKMTDELLQQFDLDCQFIGVENVSVGDYNFDGLDDFSVFQVSHSGPNTSRVYFLRNPRTKSFFRSEFSGFSLEFNPVSKTIMEVNQCCSGKQRITTVFKVVDNKMVQLEEHCFIWEEARKELVERKIGDCK